MLCIDIGDIPSELVGHALPPDALVFSNAHLPHRTHTNLAPFILDAWKERGWDVQQVESPAPRLDGKGWTPQTCLDADVHAVDLLLRHVVPKYHSQTPRGTQCGAYLKLHGCADVRRFTTGGPVFRFDDPAAHDADALQHGRVPRLDDATVAPSTLLLACTDARLQANRRAHLCDHGIGTWPEEKSPDLVARANGLRQLSLLALRRVMALVARIRLHVSAGVPILVFSTGTVSIGSHNGTNDDPWDTRSMCALCGKGSATVRAHVALDEVCHGLVTALLNHTSIDTARLRVQRGRVTIQGNGWVKTYVHADLKWYCIVHTDFHCWVYDLLNDPDMTSPLEHAPREAVTHGHPVSSDAIPAQAWLQLPHITSDEELTLVVARHAAPIVLRGHWQYHMLAHLAAQRVRLVDVEGRAVVLQGAVQVGPLRLLGKSYETKRMKWLVHQAV